MPPPAPRDDAEGRRAKAGKVVVTSASPFSRLSSFLAVVPSPGSSQAPAPPPLEQPRPEEEEREKEKEERAAAARAEDRERRARASASASTSASASAAPSASTSEVSSGAGAVAAPFWMNRNAKSCYEVRGRRRPARRAGTAVAPTSAC